MFEVDGGIRRLILNEEREGSASARGCTDVHTIDDRRTATLLFFPFAAPFFALAMLSRRSACRFECNR